MASIQQTPQGPVLVLKESALQQKGRDAQKNNIAAALRYSVTLIVLIESPVFK